MYLLIPYIKDHNDPGGNLVVHSDHGLIFRNHFCNFAGFLV